MFFVVLLALAATALSAEDQGVHIPLWPGGAPGFESRKDEPELAKDWWARNIHNPSLTAYLPTKEKATGVAIVICPGGGHTNLVVNPEGRDPALFFREMGVAAFVLKYRLFREKDSPYSFEKHTRQDAERAIRVVRSRAKEMGIDPGRVGMMGFSAGGEVVSLAAFGSGMGDAKAADPVDRLDARPNFQILIYPGRLSVPGDVPPGAPPAFLAVANEDKGSSDPAIRVMEKLRAAQIPVELHVYAHGGHAFNMGTRSSFASLRAWPQRLVEWMNDRGILAPAAAK